MGVGIEDGHFSDQRLSHYFYSGKANVSYTQGREILAYLSAAEARELASKVRDYIGKLRASLMLSE
jgi:hypothetical protein